MDCSARDLFVSHAFMLPCNRFCDQDQNASTVFLRFSIQFPYQTTQREHRLRRLRIWYNSFVTHILSDKQFEAYLAPLSAEQSSSIRALRTLIMKYAPELVEKVDDGKWFGGLLTYDNSAGQFVFAVGPRSKGLTTFHMMPFYGSKSLQERHAASLKKFLSGKSCIKFLHTADLPEEALIDIIDAGTKQMPEIMASFQKSKDSK
jgi:hypothetical protein